jgi:hypothetical protein
VAAGGGHHVQPLVAGVGLVPVVPPLLPRLGVAERARLPDAVFRPGEERRVGVALVDFRDELRARLRESWPAGVPVLTEAMMMIASYLAAKRDLGRIAAGADIDTLSAVLMGAGHRLFADRTGAPPEAAAIARMVTTVIGGIVRDPPP